MSCIWQGRRGDLDGIHMSIYVNMPLIRNMKTKRKTRRSTKSLASICFNEFQNMGWVLSDD
jgi:hypothetical protein